MDQVISKAFDYGLSGLVLAAVCWFLWWLVTKQLPEVQARQEKRTDSVIALLSGELATARADYRAGLDALQVRGEQAIVRLEVAQHEATTAITSELVNQRGAIRDLAREVRQSPNGAYRREGVDGEPP